MKKPAAGKKEFVLDALVAGAALFSMFFGAGNIIFPPRVGLEAADLWYLGHICYYLADVGLALTAVFALLRCGSADRPEGVMARLGVIPARCMMCAAVLCIGPALGIPRTCAAAWSMSVMPAGGTDGEPHLLFVGLYFAIVWLCAVRETAIVEVLGKYLTPLLLAGLLALIAAGVVNPAGQIATAGAGKGDVGLQGIIAGYETMDMIAALFFGLIVLNSLKAKNSANGGQGFASAGLAAFVAGALLFAVYGGLCYLGATVSALYPHDVEPGLLVTEIAARVLGPFGAAVLGITSSLACLTTAVALTGCVGTFFRSLTRGRWPYKAVVTAACLVSAFIACMGLAAIIKLAAPILMILYPGVIVVVTAAFFARSARSDRIVRCACAGALAGSAFDVFGLSFPGLFEALPWHDYGFAWLLPALVCGILGACIGRPGAQKRLPA
jgi:LIVCS family branched-chain amino acid:cation transporter